MVAETAGVYEFQVKYQPGKLNPTNYLSRLPLPSQKPASLEEKAAEEYIHFVFVNAVPRTVTAEHIPEETRADKVLQICMEAITAGRRHQALNAAPTTEVKSTLTGQYHVRNELTVTQAHNLVLPESRIV